MKHHQHQNQRTPAPHPTTNNTYDSASQDNNDNLALAQSYQPSFEESNAFSHPQLETADFHVGAAVSNRTYDDHDAHRFSWTINDINTSRQDTGLTNSTETSMSSSFREKLSTVSRDQAKGAWRVLKQFTFPRDPTDLQRGTSFSPMLSPGSQLHPAHRGFHNLDEPAAYDSSSSRYALPGDLLNSDLFIRRSLCEIRSTSHETKTCWCRIADDLVLAQTIQPIGNNRVSIHNLFSDDLYQRSDTFGNTAFHRLAATDGDKMTFINLISAALTHIDLPVRAANTAGQTFLHVLHQSWFGESCSLFLDELLNILKDTNFDILATDVYGRSFFHLLQIKKQDSARIPAHLFDWNLLKRRDAFGLKPMESRTRHPENISAQGMRRIVPTNARGSTLAEVPSIDIPSDSGDESRIRPQTDMLRMITDAIRVDNLNSMTPDVRSEDARGRNAFHCLAEVDLALDRVPDPTQDNSRQKKRKFKEEDDESRPERSRHNQRLEFLQGIIHARVDINQYDNQGQTPLMAFIKYRPEESRSDKEDMEKIIRMLYHAGANLEKRNRDGETALHIAGRSGKKVAMRELLQCGANPWVRDAHGLGVLAAIDDRFVNTEGDGALTARLEACRGVFTSMVKPNAQEPTVLQEWGVRRPASGSSR